MLPSLHSLATVAILKSPEASKQTFDTLSCATGHFKHLSVLFLFEGNSLFRSFLRNFCALQTSNNTLVLREAMNYMNIFQQHTMLVNHVCPDEMIIVRRFLRDFQIVNTDMSYRHVTFDVGATQFEKDLILRTLNI